MDKPVRKQHDKKKSQGQETL